MSGLPARPPLSVAWIGCGNMSRQVHMPIVQALGDFRVAAVCDRDPGRAAHAAALFPEASVFTDPAALAASVRCDVVAVVLPPQYLLDALRAVAEVPRLAVFTEKPLGRSLADAEEIAALLPDGVSGFCGFNRRFWPALGVFRRLLARGGDLTLLEASFHKHVADREPWRDTADSLVFTEMCHALDLLLEAGGPVAECRFAGGGFSEDGCDVLVGSGTFRSGALWTVSCNFASGGMETRLVGHARGVRVSLTGAQRLELSPGSGAPAVFSVGERFPWTWTEGYEQEWRAFARSLRTGEPSPGSFDAALETMRLCDRALRQTECALR